MPSRNFTVRPAPVEATPAAASTIEAPDDITKELSATQSSLNSRRLSHLPSLLFTICTLPNGPSLGTRLLHQCTVVRGTITLARNLVDVIWIHLPAPPGEVRLLRLRSRQGQRRRAGGCGGSVYLRLDCLEVHLSRRASSCLAALRFGSNLIIVVQDLMSHRGKP